MNKPHNDNPAIRQGQFLWKKEEEKQQYLVLLKKKIQDGYYFTDKVISSIVEEIAPVIKDTMEHDGVLG